MVQARPTSHACFHLGATSLLEVVAVLMKDSRSWCKSSGAYRRHQRYDELGRAGCGVQGVLGHRDTGEYTDRRDDRRLCTANDGSGRSSAV